MSIPIKIALICLLLGNTPMPNATEQQVAFNCIFPKTAPGVKPAIFDALAIFIPDYGKEYRGQTFELIDPANLARGATFETLVNGKNAGDFAFMSNRSSNRRMILIARSTAQPAVFDTTISNFDPSEKPRIGQCAVMGEGARQSFDYWKLHPDKIGDTPE